MTTRLTGVVITGAILAVTGPLMSGCASTAVPPATVVRPATTSTASTSASPVEASTAPAPAVTESNPPGDIPDNQAFVAYQVPNESVSVKVPEGWARTANAPDTTFTDKLNRIAVRAGQASAPATVASVTAELTSLQQQVPQFAAGKVSVVTRAGQKAILLTYKGDSPVDPVTGKVVRDAFERYTFTNGSRRLDLTLSGPEAADNVDPWRIVSDSVVWK